MTDPTNMFNGLPSSQSFQDAYDEAIKNGEEIYANTLITMRDIIRKINPDDINSFIDLSRTLDEARRLCFERSKEQACNR